MSQKIFSKKKAISHGIQMTKKYFRLFLMMGLVYLAFQGPQWILQKNAGVGDVMKGETVRLNNGSFDVYEYLQDEGYINKAGEVLPKMQEVNTSSDLILPAGQEGIRDKIFNVIRMHQYRLPFPKLVYYFILVLLWVLNVFVSIGATKIILMINRDENPEIAELYLNGALLPNMIIGNILFFLAIMGGFILLIVPGIIFSIALGMYSFLIVDKQMGPVEALNASRALTKGVRWQIFCFGALIGLFNLAGALCLLVGLLFTIPASYVASAYVYDQLCLKSEATENA